MFNLYNVSSTVILMGTLIYIAKQTNIQKKDLEMRINYQKREKAIEMAKVFSELIDKTILVSEVLKNLEAINKINISDSDYNHLNYFDEDELKKLFDEDDLGKIKSEINIENIGLEKYISAYAITGDSSLNKFKDEIIFLINEKFLRNEKTKQEYDKMDIIIKREFSKTMVELLNQLEWFSMHFMSDIAEEKTVYQSLHQIYLKTIKLYYPHIAYLNRKGIKDKYYCNIIGLYVKWANIYHKEKEDEVKRNKKISDLKQKEKEKEVMNKTRQAPSARRIIGMVMGVIIIALGPFIQFFDGHFAQKALKYKQEKK